MIVRSIVIRAWDSLKILDWLEQREYLKFGSQNMKTLTAEKVTNLKKRL